MSLKEEINTMQQAMLPNIPGAALKTMQQATKSLVNSDITAACKDVGDAVPMFTLQNSAGIDISLAALLKKGPVVLNFYRGGWCPYCNLELRALDRMMADIHALGAELVSITPNLPEKTAAYIDENPFGFDILSDTDLTVSRQFGLVFSLAETLRPIYNDFGINLTEYDGNTRYELPIPATYIINSDGLVRHAYLNPDYTQRMEPADIISALRNMKGDQQ